MYVIEQISGGRSTQIN